MSKISINIGETNDSATYKAFRDWANLCQSTKCDTTSDDNIVILRNINNNALKSISMTFSYDWKPNNRFVRRKKIEKIFNI